MTQSEQAKPQASTESLTGERQLDVSIRRRDEVELELQKLVRRQTTRPTHGARNLLIAYWALYPITLLEAALMGMISGAFYWIMRLFYLPVWFPEKGRQRPHRMKKGAIDSENALGAMQMIEDAALASRARIFWISGTLLGLERLGQPLPHDNDLDVGLDVNDPHIGEFIRNLWRSPDIIEIAPQCMSWKTRMQNPDFQIPGGIIRYKATVLNPMMPEKSEVKLDLFLHFPHSDGVIHGTRNSIWWNTTPDISKRMYRNRGFSVPSDAHLYLTENYGNYQNEVKDFENTIDCPNAMNIFSWRSLATLLSRLQMMIKLGRLDRASRINKRISATILKGLMPVPGRAKISP